MIAAVIRWSVANRFCVLLAALILVGDAVKASGYERSKLYDPSFTTGYRKGKEQ